MKKIQGIIPPMITPLVDANTLDVQGAYRIVERMIDAGVADSLALAQHAAKCGAAAVVSAPPYYFPANQKELIDWYTALADASPLPVFLYNMPSKVKVFLNVSTHTYLTIVFGTTTIFVAGFIISKFFIKHEQ